MLQIENCSHHQYATTAKCVRNKCFAFVVYLNKLCTYTYVYKYNSLYIFAFIFSSHLFHTLYCACVQSKYSGRQLRWRNGRTTWWSISSFLLELWSVGNAMSMLMAICTLTAISSLVALCMRDWQLKRLPLANATLSS